MKIHQLFEDSALTNEYDSKYKSVKLYHGTMNYYENGDTIKFRFRNKPTHTSIIFHNEVNKLTVKKFGLPIRNLFFTTMSQTASEYYGDVYQVIPFNGFRIFTSDYEDMTVDLKVAKDPFIHDIHDTFIYSAETPEEREITKQLSRQLETVLNHLDTQDIDDLLDIIKNMISQSVDDSNMANKFYNVMSGKCKEYQGLAEKYVSTIQEITTAEELSSLSTTYEVMIYSPQGFLVKEV